AHSQATSVHFFGLPISVHRAIEPALRCVEKRIRATCQRGADHYTPRAIGGFRDRNTYRGGEVSNHMFGIAIDIDPERNPCCGCVEPWPQHPACQTHGANAVESAALPKCWIEGFERYGFYWLGRDPQLRDTMHFEFLGNPERVVAR
ncbi:MAG TPA: M15 family metallopeptidase, partial [Polyangiaceae bacterium]|nr:M15 family metallopeptidase [Polyangiaceae bacterium]